MPHAAAPTLARNTSSVCRLSLRDRKSTRLNSSHSQISYAVFCLKKKKSLLVALEERRDLRHDVTPHTLLQVFLVPMLEGGRRAPLPRRVQGRLRPGLSAEVSAMV